MVKHLDSKSIFEHQLHEAITLYPGLRIVDGVHEKYLCGALDILDHDGGLWDQFMIEIHRSPRFPMRFPVLYEVGGRIPISQEWHIYVSDPGPKKSCCITVPPIEFVKCRSGISVSRYISDEVIPYLYKQAYRIHYGYYPGKEFDHGTEGIFEYYEELFGTKDSSKILDILSTYSNKVHKKSKCFCGKNKQLRKCHPEAYISLKSLHPEFLGAFKELIKMRNQNLLISV